MKSIFNRFLLALLCLSFTALSVTYGQVGQSKVLVFFKTKGWKHSSIPFGIKAIQKLGIENNFSVDTSSNSEVFSDQSLKQYRAVIFNNTTGDILNNEQQAAFERYIQAGGGFVGIHSAADTEYTWAWYGELIGAYFSSHPNHPNVRVGAIEVLDKKHLSTAHLPDNWQRTDEWYSYKGFFHGIKVLANLDENTYEGGTNGGNHPISWYHEYDGGRAFYTGLGHTDESYSEPLFLQHLLGGIQYAIGKEQSLDYSKSYSRAVPDENRFQKTVLVNDLNNPMELAVANDGRIFFTELSGNFSVFDTKTNKHQLIHRFPVTMKGGTGMIGITLDPNFDKNQWVYLYYCPPIEGEPIIYNLSRFTIDKNNKIDLNSEKILLQVPVSANGGSHHGGSLAFDKNGHLFLSTGDSTTPFPSDGFAPIDERPENKDKSMDAQRSASNTNDLKGKILRIHPKNDGTYDIPEGNLFPVGMEKTRPEIYAMGCRNPYRIAVNPKTSTVYWGEIGPDAGEDKVRGPRGYDEFNQAKKAGNFGWPYFVGNNYAYSEWDFATATPGPTFDPLKPFNNSPNNTGLNELPAATPPMIWYPYSLSKEFPELGTGGRSAMAGQFYTFNKNSQNPNQLPSYYDGALFVFDWMRNWMLALRFDEQEKYIRSEKFMPNFGDFRRPIDLAFSNDGIMYVLEYGSVYGADNVDARLVKIEDNSQNRAPVAAAFFVDEQAINKVNEQSFITSETKNYPKPKELSGKTPFSFKARGNATDPDFDDKVHFEWYLKGKQIGKGNEISYTIKNSGKHSLIFKATDAKDLSSSDTLSLILGNQKPEINVKSQQNLSFYWENQVFDYEIVVKDTEDKSINTKKIKTFYNYNPQPLSPESGTSQSSKAIKQIEAGSIGKTLIESSDCKACHTLDKTAVGPSFVAISKRYTGREGSVQLLTKKIIEGGGGNWGNTHVMAAHPQLAKQDVTEMVNYILSLSDPKKDFKSIGTKGKLSLDEHKNEKIKGFFTIKATYTDNGFANLPPQKNETQVELRYHVLRAMDADSHPGFNFEWGQLRQGDSKAYLVYKNIDMKNIQNISFEYASLDKNGEIEIRLNSMAGPVLGKIAYQATGSWDKMNWVNCPLDKNLNGFYDLYFVAIKKEKPNDKIIKFKSIKFE